MPGYKTQPTSLSPRCLPYAVLVEGFATCLSKAQRGSKKTALDATCTSLLVVARESQWLGAASMREVR